MQAEVIAIGDELTSGERVDTNSCWLSQRLLELGVPVMFHSTVGDDLACCVDVLKRAVERAEIVIVTGGLGPTADDLTRDAIAQATGTDLQLDEATVAEIAQMFRRRGREMPESNRVQAMFPEGSQKINNPHGTAPGIEMAISREGRSVAGVSETDAVGGSSYLFALPGVPAEMKPMWTETVSPRVRDIAPALGMIRHRKLKCFGVGESKLESMLPDLIRRGREPSVGITVHAATITLRVTARGPDETAIDAAVRPTIQTIYESLGTLVFGEGDDELQNAVTRLLLEKGKTVASAECATGGLVASWFGEVADSASVYRGGEVHAVEVFGQSGSVADAVKRMAVEVRERFGADYGLAIGPLPDVVDGASENASEDVADRSQEQFFVALADEKDVQLHTGRTFAHPAIRKELAGKQALDRLRLRLLGEEKREV